jgi:glycyl-tRNA synthetase beta chain
MNALLLEIGVEEIPARFLLDAIKNLKETATGAFEENAIGYSDISAYATPRRLAFIATGVSETQPDRVREILGPPKKAAFDEQGNPTKAAIGFAAQAGIVPENLTIVKKGKGEYVAALLKEKGLPVRELLPAVLKKIILTLHFPKSMRWADGSLRFVRPIRWIAAILNGETVEFELDGIRSGNITCGHRFLSPGFFRLKEANGYPGMLEGNYVIVDHEKRKRLISEQLTALASTVSGHPVMDDELLLTVSNLVEYPLGVLGSFSSGYLSLPHELLITVMKGHQKYFSVLDKEGELTNHFIAISNTRPENHDTVRAGAERVLRARFDDARFYFEEDGKRTLSGRLEDIKKVTFHDRLGSLYEKTMRIKATASSIAEELIPGKKQAVERSALLSKTDLITGVVREFPELQGIMGRYYALHDGEDVEVAESIMEHYLPKHSGDSLPSSDAGAVLAIADRMDNIASFFRIGLTPTGSEDPFALRRQALGTAAILREKGYKIPIEKILDIVLSNLKNIKGDGDFRAEILRFFEQRLDTQLQSEGYAFDIVQSVSSFFTTDSLSSVIKRLEALKGFSEQPFYNSFLTAFKRVRNIIQQKTGNPVREDFLREEKEKALYGKLNEVGGNIVLLIETARFDEAIEELSKLTVPVNEFFDNVLVMDKDEAVKGNRLNLLCLLWRLASGIADFAKLQERGQ